MILEYNSSVLVTAGWRSISITAEATPSGTGKKAEVVKVLEIDGEDPTGYHSRTGSKRQTFNADYIANREMGAVKIVSKCNIIKES